VIESRRKVTSQFGQDGVLEETFRRIGEGNQWCVEVAAGDGYNLSNTYNLIQNYGWSAVLIEAEPGRAEDMRNRYAGAGQVHCVEAKVEDLGAVLSTIPQLPGDFDLLSIDVDGDDYHLWSSLGSRYRPKAVLIETNPTFGWDVVYVPKPGNGEKVGSSLAAIQALATSLDYRLACYIEIDALYVALEHWEKMCLVERSLSDHMKGSDAYIPRVVSDQHGQHYLLRAGPWRARSDDDVLSGGLRSRSQLADNAMLFQGALRHWEL
jgi:hypothetical protein